MKSPLRGQQQQAKTPKGYVLGTAGLRQTTNDAQNIVGWHVQVLWWDQDDPTDDTGTWQPGIVLQLVPGVPSEQMRIFYPDDGWDEVMDLDEPTVAWRKKGSRAGPQSCSDRCDLEEVKAMLSGLDCD